MTIRKLSARACRNNPGFTLIEVMVSLTIMTMVLAVSYSGLRVGLNAWERGGRVIDDLDRRALVERLIRRQLPLAYPMNVRFEDESVPMFRGTAERLEFIADYSLADGPSGFRKIDYAADGGRFLYGERPVFGYAPEDDEPLPATSLAAFGAVSFEYLGVDAAGSPAWVPDWPLGRALPAVVRVRIDGDVLIVPLVNRVINQ